MTHKKFLAWLLKTKPTSIVFEACGTSNYWKQKATEAGHKAQLISAKLVATVRQNQKTDINDALAIVQASQLPEIQFIKGKRKRKKTPTLHQLSYKSRSGNAVGVFSCAFQAARCH